jgi:hypothetical protein
MRYPLADTAVKLAQQHQRPALTTTALSGEALDNINDALHRFVALCRAALAAQ